MSTKTTASKNVKKVKKDIVKDDIQEEVTSTKSKKYVITKDKITNNTNDKMALSKQNYNYKSWYEKFPDCKVDLSLIPLSSSWNIKNTESYKELDAYLSKIMLNANKANIYPYPDLLFSALNHTSLDDIKVVILGQDPYHGCEFYDKKTIPQAMGLSFSVPKGVIIPSSLKNIYKNLAKYNHLLSIPQHGNLEFWAYQGCLLLNTSLTVIEGSANCHSSYWVDFTDSIIEQISDEKENIVFILWGKNALMKQSLIDTKRHKIICSSHPSGLSVNKTTKDPFDGTIHPAFENVDHFGLANEYLKKIGKEPILWQIE
jgi:uracil-DNA glycosylase